MAQVDFATDDKCSPTMKNVNDPVWYAAKRAAMQAKRKGKAHELKSRIANRDAKRRKPGEGCAFDLKWTMTALVDAQTFALSLSVTQNMPFKSNQLG